MPLMAHLRELRGRMIRVAVAILLCGTARFIFRNRLIQVLQHPVCSIQGVAGIGHPPHECRNGVLTPTAGMSLAFDVAIFTGLVHASPIWLYQLWAFIAPGLYK